MENDEEYATAFHQHSGVLLPTQEMTNLQLKILIGVLQQQYI